MIECYHEDVTFQDSAFGTLRGKRAGYMWLMLLSNKNSDVAVEYAILEAEDMPDKVSWVAEYKYGPKKRNVINRVAATFEFKDDKIIRHTDYFDLWAWSRQALGLSGYALGWSSWMKNKIQEETNKRLSQFIANKNLPTEY